MRQREGDRGKTEVDETEGESKRQLHRQTNVKNETYK